MEGALHYQNVPTSQGSSQRAKSSTYPTNSMYARAQETMLKMRDVAKEGMVKAAKTAKQGMASIERSINAPPARSAAASRPVGQRTAVGVNPPGFNGDSTINGALDNDVAVSERLQGAEAAAEMLFEMRAANDGNPTPEEAEMLSELRAVCEQHLNVLAMSVERGRGSHQRDAADEVHRHGGVARGCHRRRGEAGGGFGRIGRRDVRAADDGWRGEGRDGRRRPPRGTGRGRRLGSDKRICRHI